MANRFLTIAELADEVNAIWNKNALAAGLDPEVSAIRICYAQNDDRDEYIARLQAKAAFTGKPNLLPTGRK